MATRPRGVNSRARPDAASTPPLFAPCFRIQIILIKSLASLALSRRLIAPVIYNSGANFCQHFFLSTANLVVVCVMRRAVGVWLIDSHERKRDAERRAAAFAFALGRDRAAVEFDDVKHD
ncbi:MAG: hypothetical protein QOG00_833 [Pyrinomonadaceae bacterium]|nr:hypothetical protein [Pyrinomonadaceae bacterium]